MNNNELKYWLAFNQIDELGPVRWKILLHYFGNLENAWQAKIGQWVEAGFNNRLTEKIIAQKTQISPDRTLEQVKKIGCQVITTLDEQYPKLLKEIYAPPPLLYCLGQLNLNHHPTLAVVGTRKISDYGQQTTQHLVGELAGSGLVIISGLALGVDALAHRATLQAGGKTVAVLGSGIDVIVPSSNYQLANQIIENGGTIISEFAPGAPPQKFTFPQRNRVISGLSLGTLIIEAAKKSGALITAHCALEQNREVFAIPGSIYHPNSGGTNNLIKLGAKMVTEANDILETLNIKVIKKSDANQIQKFESPAEKIIFEIITTQPTHIDKLVKISRMNISVVNSLLSILEMKGLIKNLGNHTFVKTL